MYVPNLHSPFPSPPPTLKNPPPTNSKTDTAWHHRPLLPHERTSLWRLLRNQQSGVTVPALRAANDETTLLRDARDKFLTLQPLFWVRYADFMDIVPRHPHLGKGMLYTRAMAVQGHPVEGAGAVVNGAVGATGAGMNGHL